ncbi:MAG: tRNA (adenine-N1)-methyltransferase [archaeon]|nr:tRNA (adenine-N1)-methyltransferase [archaeon]
MKMILDERGKKYLLKEGQDFQSDLGIVSAEDIANATFGDELLSHLDYKFKIVKPNVNDFIDLMDRRCSILIKKDIGSVLSYTGLGAGDKVVDAGTGAGAIALNFGNVVGETGKVTSYEIREDFAEVARKNIETFGITNIEIKNKDIKEGIDEDDLDLIFLDLPKPFEIFEEVYDSLKVGGYLVVYAPYINQAETSYLVAKKLNFYNIDIIETLERGLEVRQQGVRPKTRMVGHSGYLMFARKL